MKDPVKIRVKGGESFVMNANSPHHLADLQDMTEDDSLTAADLEYLPESSLTKDDWLEFVGDALTDNNYHPERRIVENAVGFMTEDKAVEYLRQVGRVMP